MYNTAASVLISHPHFYNGDKTYLQNVKGLNPKLEHHQTFIDIEPVRKAQKLFPIIDHSSVRFGL